MTPEQWLKHLETRKQNTEKLPFEPYAFQRELMELIKRSLHKKRDEHCRLILINRWRL